MKNLFRNWLEHFPAWLLFLLLSLGMTFPLLLHLDDHLPSDLGDPLYNVWAMAWNTHKLTSGLKGFWDANIFYPHHGTLLYADYLFALSLLGAPVVALSGNPILAYNILFIFSFFLSALGMYYLVHHLTGSRAAAVISGLIFAFFPYRFAHISHLELLYSAWMPFCFLWLHKFFENRSYRNLFGLGAFLLLQALSCAYYGLYLIFFASIFILFFAIERSLLLKKDFWQKMGILIVFCFITLVPFFFPYLKVHQRMMFARSLNFVKYYSAQLQHFLSVPPWNVIWGGMGGSAGAQEWQLYPGIIPVILTAYFLTRRKKVTDSEKPDISSQGSIHGWRQKNAWKFYLLISILALLLAFGPVIQFFDRELFVGPYWLLYNWIPGFQGLRVPSRLVVIMMLGISVLSGMAIANFIRKRRSLKMRILVPFLLGGLLLADYLSIPLPLAGVHVKDEIPPIYSFLKNLPENTSLLELPIPARGLGKSKEALYIYYSIFHWKRLVNGYSGYIPPGYIIIGEAMENFPSQKTFSLLQNLNVDYLLIHTEWFLSDKAKETVSQLKNFENHLECIAASQGDYLYRLIPQKTQDKKFLRPVGEKQKWTALSNANPSQTEKAFDGNNETGWSTGRPQQEGDYFLLDFGSVYEIKKIEISLSRRPLDYPRGYRLEGSSDGKKWNLLSEDSSSFPDLNFSMIEDYSKYKMEISFPSSEVRYLRMTLTLSHRNRAWSIQEIICMN